MIPRNRLDVSIQKNQGELFLLMYILKNYKGNFFDIMKGFDGVDEKILKFIKKHDLSFFGKYNTQVYKSLNDIEIIKELEFNGIEPYLESDYNNFSVVIEFLDDFYSKKL